jgi:hypothetical protein
MTFRKCLLFLRALNRAVAVGDGFAGGAGSVFVVT